MDQNLSNLFLEFYRSRDLLYYIQNMGFRVPEGMSDKSYINSYINIIENNIDTINSMANELSFDNSKFKKLFELYLKSGENKDFYNLKKFIHYYYKIVEQDISKIPNSLDKSYAILKTLINLNAYEDEYQVYDALVLLKDEIPDEEVEKIFSHWKEGFHNGICYVSPNYMGDMDTVSHYRFKETFKFVEFNYMFKKIDFELQFRLLEFLFSEDLEELAFNLWLMDRIPNFIIMNIDLISFVLKFIARQWNPNGYWDSNVIKTVHERVIEEENYQSPEIIFGEKINIQIGFNEESKQTEKRIVCEPSNYITALCSLNLLKHPVSDHMREIGILGAKWLSENQNPDGSWSDFDFTQKFGQTGRYIKFCNGKNISKPDLFVTLIAIEAIFRSEIPNKEKYIKRGFDWVKKQQNEIGSWDKPKQLPNTSFPLIIILVLELKKLINIDANIPNLDYLVMSKDFLDSAVRFLSDDSLNSRRLAIITTFHGVEFFLYSILKDINIKIFDKDKTIGMIKALNKYEEYLRHKKQLEKGSVINYKNSLFELRNYRDNIIHQGYSIEKIKCEDLIENTRKFVSENSIKMWNIDILNNY